MIVLSILLVLLFGYSVINVIGQNHEPLEKFGISFLTGIGLETIFMLILDIAHIPITLVSLYLLTLAGIVIINFQSLLQFILAPAQYIKPLPEKSKAFYSNISFNNLIWVLFFLLVALFIVSSVAKALYWPPAAYDNISGYDLMGKVIASEGKFHNSLFEINNTPIQGSAKRLIYPPLVSGSFAFAYLHNLKTSKIITALFFIFFAFAFYALLRKETNKITSISGLFLTVITPEFYAFTSLSTTNIPFAIYTSIGLIYLYRWHLNKTKSNLLFAALFLGFSSFIRSEGIVFILLGMLLIAIATFKSRNFKSVLLFTALSLPFFLAWDIYISFNFNVSQLVFKLYPYWDPEKLKIMFGIIVKLVLGTGQFGITFYALILAVLVNIKFLGKDKSSVFLIITVSAWFLFTLLYYQIDYSVFGNLVNVMNASYRRALFCFVPLIWFYVSTNYLSRLGASMAFRPLISNNEE